MLMPKENDFNLLGHEGFEFVGYSPVTSQMPEFRFPNNNSYYPVDSAWVYIFGRHRPTTPMCWFPDVSQITFWAVAMESGSVRITWDAEMQYPRHNAQFAKNLRDLHEKVMERIIAHRLNQGVPYG